MFVARRLRALRAQKKLSRGDIEKRTGLLRRYISRLEDGHVVPSIEILEMLAQALDVPLHRFFYDGEIPPKLSNLLGRKTVDDILRGTASVSKLRYGPSRTDEHDRKALTAIFHKSTTFRKGNRPGIVAGGYEFKQQQKARK